MGLASSIFRKHVDQTVEKRTLVELKILRDLAAAVPIRVHARTGIAGTSAVRWPYAGNVCNVTSVKYIGLWGTSD